MAAEDTSNSGFLNKKSCDLRLRATALLRRNKTGREVRVRARANIRPWDFHARQTDATFYYIVLQTPTDLTPWKVINRHQQRIAQNW